MTDDPYKELKSVFFSSRNSQMNKCLERSMQCTNKAIRAHSIQNARVLDLLCENGHVVQLRHSYSGDEPPKIEFNSIGRKQATTFAGLCADHDRAIFEDIDTKEFDAKNERQLFLIAYRSVLRELHATMDGAVSIQGSYQKRVELGLDPKDAPSPAGMEAVFHMVKAWRTYRYKCKFDDIDREEDYDSFVHFVRVIDTHSPTIGASAFFGIGKYTGEEDIVGVILNIFPLGRERTLVVLSYLKEHESQVNAEHHSLLTSDGHYFNYLVSKTLLRRCENFVISPEYFNSWTQEKRDKIADYFVDTMLDSDHDEESEHLYMF